MAELAEVKIIPWPSLIRQPVPGSDTPEVPVGPMKALACRNSVASLALVVTSSAPARAKLRFTDLKAGSASIRAGALVARLAVAIPTPEVGPVIDALYEVDEFTLDAMASFYVSASIP